MPRALLSVSDKTGVVAFATALVSRGFELVSTGGTAQGSFYRSAADRKGQPEGIGVDPRDGSFYVSDHSRGNIGYIAKFSATGHVLREYSISTR